MESFSQKIVSKTREYRIKHLSDVAKFFLRLGITADLMTGISLLLGLSGVYFLLQNHWLFVILMLLHLGADALDGVIARVSQPTVFGKYFDLVSDRIITIFCFLKIAFYLQDYYVYIMLGLMILTKLIYFLSRLEYPVVFVRLGVVIALMFAPLNYTVMLTLTYLVTGGFILYSLALQLQYFVKTKWSRP